jgi:hypothetical protein
MKEICKLFFVTLVVFLCSCNKITIQKATTTITKSIEEQAFEEFINSKNLYTECYMTKKVDTTELKEHIFNITITDKIIKLSTPKNDIVLIFDVNESRLVYINEEKDKNIYSEINNSIEDENFKNNLNFCDYFENIIYEENKVVFDFNINKLYEDLLDNENESLNVSNDSKNIDNLVSINMIAYVNNKKISKLDMNIGNLLNDTESIVLSLDYINYEQNNITSIEYDSLEKLHIESLIENISDDFSQSLEPEEPPFVDSPKNYKFKITKEYELKLGGEFVLNGTLMRNDKTIISFDECEVKYSPKLDLTKIGTTNYRVLVIYNGMTFTDRFFLHIYDEIEVEEKIQIDCSNIKNSFICNEYLLIADETKLYKLDFKDNKIVGTVDLKCIANSIYLKDDYLYVAAYYPYTSKNLSSGDYDGTISKIKFSNFTLMDQMHVDCLPYNIIVDNRDNIIISKGLNQWIEYSIINLEEKTIDDFYIGYEEDYLIYNSEKDAFLVCTQNSTSNNYWVYYKDGAYDNVSKPTQSTLDAVYIGYFNIDGKYIISSSYRTVRLSFYDPIIGDYNSKEFKNFGSEKYGFDEYMIFGEDFVTLADDTIYILRSDKYNTCKVLITINTNTNEVNEIQLKVSFGCIKNIFVYGNKIYVVYDNQYIEVFNLNKK